ncbi:MAG: helix-turn-helix domain-containing protein [Acidobacteriota bacterium]|nr:helix-turn-helix domain-containing protein [Acidobacteriota bacterium]
MSEQRVFSWEFKEEVARRMLNGESVSALHHELQIKRSVLYRWRDAYRKEGVVGLQRVKGRPPGAPNPPRPAGWLAHGEHSHATRDTVLARILSRCSSTEVTSSSPPP